MPTPFVSKLLTLGLTAILGGAGLVAGPSVGASIIERPVAPTSVSIGSAPLPEALRANPTLAARLDALDPAVLADPEVARLLRDPQVLAALEDPAVLEALAGIDPAVLSRPAVLEAVRARQLTPGLLADPVVMANLPSILRALPTLERAFGNLSAVRTGAVSSPEASATASPEASATVTVAGPTASVERTTSPAAPTSAATSEGTPARGRRAEAHAARDARREVLTERQEARRAILRDGRTEAPRGLTRAQREQLAALSETARLALRELGGLARDLSSEPSSDHAPRGRASR